MSEPKEDLRDAIIGRLTLDLEMERKLCSEMLAERRQLREALEKVLRDMPNYRAFSSGFQ